MTTPNMEKSLSNIFDIDLSNTIDESKSIAEVKADAIAADIKSLEAQREYVKANLVKIIERGMTALGDLNVIASSTEKGRDFEVMSTMMKTLVDTNVELLNMEVAHKPKFAQTENTPNQQVTNNTAVFVGSTKELADYVRQISNNTDEE
jgi:hypothetical protein